MTTKACISAGVCGLQTTVTARADGSQCAVVIDSDCRWVRSLAEELATVDPLKELFAKDGPPRIWQLAARHRLHAACPVPAGILKTIEVEAGLALPADVLIALSRE